MLWPFPAQVPSDWSVGGGLQPLSLSWRAYGAVWMCVGEIFLLSFYCQIGWQHPLIMCVAICPQLRVQGEQQPPHVLMTVFLRNMERAGTVPGKDELVFGTSLGWCTLLLVSCPHHLLWARVAKLRSEDKAKFLECCMSCVELNHIKLWFWKVQNEKILHSSTDKGQVWSSGWFSWVAELRCAVLSLSVTCTAWGTVSCFPVQLSYLHQQGNILSVTCLGFY